jgi:hypothetical protein
MSALPDQLPRPRSSPTGNGGSSGIVPPLKPLLQVAGGLGLAGVLLGFTILIASCAGLDAALYFSPAVIVLGVGDLVLTGIAIRQRPVGNDSSTLASLFLALLSILGGLFEFAALLHWPILSSQPV